jgi:hypothetical protein
LLFICKRKKMKYWDTSLIFNDNFAQAQLSFVGPCFLEVIACATWKLEHLES